MSKDFLYPLRVLHGKIHESTAKYRSYWKYKNKIKEKQKANKQFVFLVLTPHHGNLGDHAIALAEINLLKSINVDYIEITGKELWELKHWKILDIMNSFPILINGGGNLGTLWFSVEELMRDIVQSNPQSPVLILPNTIFYENSDWGNNELEKSRSIYNSHNRVYLYAREKRSYNIMNEIYNNVKLVPDMVLLLNQFHFDIKRKGCLLCLRGDIERTRSDQRDNIIRDQAETLFGENISITDTVLDHGISLKYREEELMKKFNQFAGAELVITDRLHGMIFCAITGTPCIVINSKSPKVKGCYEWIKDLEFIQFADDASNIADIYNNIPKKEFKYDNLHLKGYYDNLAQDILNEL